MRSRAISRRLRMAGYVPPALALLVTTVVVLRLFFAGDATNEPGAVFFMVAVVVGNCVPWILLGFGLLLAGQRSRAAWWVMAVGGVVLALATGAALAAVVTSDDGQSPILLVLLPFFLLGGIAVLTLFAVGAGVLGRRGQSGQVSASR
jgi:hypothetical protein